MGYRRILLAVDPEGLGEAALPIVAALAQVGAGQVTLLGVTPAKDSRERRVPLEDHLQRATAALAGVGVRARSELRQAGPEASAADVVVAEAEAVHADLVALGSHGHGSLAAILLGSTGREVVAKVQGPVLFVPSPERLEAGSSLLATPVRRILVPVDFSEAARQSLRVASDLAAQSQGSILLLHVRELMPWGDIPYIESAEDAQQLVDGLVTELPAGTRVEARIAAPEANPAPTIAKTAEEWSADLIVMGSRRLTALGGLLLGSVAQGVLHRTKLPVLLAGHPSHEPARTDPGSPAG